VWKVFTYPTRIERMTSALLYELVQVLRSTTELKGPEPVVDGRINIWKNISLVNDIQHEP
jgi:hypothetical protein